jgi:hypothetical protein
MDIPYQLKQIGLFFAKDRFIPVQKKRAQSLMPLVERDGVAREEPSHDSRYGGHPGTKEEMDVVREQGKGVATGFPCGEYLTGAIDKALTVDIVVKHGAPPPENQVMKCTRSVDAALSCHEEKGNNRK